MSAKFRVGVVMPTFNQAKFLPAALASFFAQEVPVHVEATLVVVDDCSTDDTWEILRAHPKVAQLVRHDANRGAAAAINTGVERIVGGATRMQPALVPDVDALSWISSDNEMSTGWLAAMVRALEAGAGLAYGGFHWIPPRGAARYLFAPYDPKRLISDQNCYIGPAFLCRADVWLEAGPHRGRISHDYDHWLRVEEACWARGLPIVGVDRSLCRYNAHDERATVVRADQYDAGHWQAAARERRASK